ncbi:unnamed protein product [Meganyctiphanes norvegica]|uniref:C-type lectin domain-containing protein n=1 Tax=Meganyctiphanes norvegica TaxID=48144 RepID=A0AAV2Q9X1_MEGNR
MPRLMDLLHQINTRALRCPECFTKRVCRSSGGICLKNTTTCSATVDIGCRGEGCTCCIQSNKCWKRRTCRRLGGSCVPNCESCPSLVIYAGCAGNCVCCVPPRNSVTNSSFTTTLEPGPIGSGSSSVFTEITTTAPPPRCAPGFFALGDECFKLFSEEEVAWGVADIRCTKFDRPHTFLAEPKDSAALAQYVFDNGGRLHHYWVGGRGTGASIKWNSGGKISLTTEPWEVGQPSGFSSSLCLDLRMDANPLSKPLAVHTCKQALVHCYICESSRRL